MRIHAIIVTALPASLAIAPGRVLEEAAYTSPAVDVTDSGRVLDRHRFQPPPSPDLSPRTITLTLPDGYAERFDDRTGLPKVMHHA